MITEDYVGFETAKLLKEKGFDETCRAFWKEWNGELHLCACSSAHVFEFCHNSMLEGYNDDGELNVAAPTLQMAMKWLREIYKFEVRSTYDYDKDSWWGNIEPMLEETDENMNIYQKALRFDYQGKSYEEACEAGIRYCLENSI